DVDAGQGDELVPVAQRRQLVLEPGDGGVVEVLLQVEAGRAVVAQQLARVRGVHRLRELAGEAQVRGAGLAPHQVGVRGVGHAAADRMTYAVPDLVDASGREVAGDEGVVVGVEVRRQQVRRFRVGTRKIHRRRA